MEIRSRGYVRVYVLSTIMLTIHPIYAKLNVPQVLITMLTTPPEDVCLTVLKQQQGTELMLIQLQDNA